MDKNSWVEKTANKIYNTFSTCQTGSVFDNYNGGFTHNKKQYDPEKSTLLAQAPMESITNEQGRAIRRFYGAGSGEYFSIQYINEEPIRYTIYPSYANMQKALDGMTPDDVNSSLKPEENNPSKDVD